MPKQRQEKSTSTGTDNKSLVDNIRQSTGILPYNFLTLVPFLFPMKTPGSTACYVSPFRAEVVQTFQYGRKIHGLHSCQPVDK